MMSPAQRVLELARETAILRAADLKIRNISRQNLYRLHRQGKLKRVGRGLYTLTDAEPTENHTITAAARRVPNGVICLLSALRFHELTTQAPFEVWMAIEQKARRPRSASIPLRIIYMSSSAFDSGIEEHNIGGVHIRIYSAAKTVADCFKFRNHIGLDVAIEALRDYRRHQKFNMISLIEYSRICRVSKVMRPYMEAIV